jgi:hypothetical protein
MVHSQITVSRPALPLLTRLRLRQRLLISMRACEIELQKHDPAQNSSLGIQESKVAEAQILCTRLLATQMLLTADEMIWDDLGAEFERMLQLVKEIINDEAEQKTHVPFSHFSTEFGVLKVLYFIISKCRRPSIRHSALQILGKLDHFEGIWHAQRMAIYLRELVRIEEAGQDITKPSDILQAQRIPVAGFEYRDQGIKVVQTI